MITVLEVGAGKHEIEVFFDKWYPVAVPVPDKNPVVGKEQNSLSRPGLNIELV